MWSLLGVCTSGLMILMSKIFNKCKLMIGCDIYYKFIDKEL